MIYHPVRCGLNLGIALMTRGLFRVRGEIFTPLRNLQAQLHSLIGSKQLLHLSQWCQPQEYKQEVTTRRFFF